MNGCVSASCLDPGPFCRSALKLLWWARWSTTKSISIPLLTFIVRVSSVNMRLVSLEERLVKAPLAGITCKIYIYIFFLVIGKVVFCSLSRAPALNLFKAHLVVFRNAGKTLGTICHTGLFLTFSVGCYRCFHRVRWITALKGSTSHFITADSVKKLTQPLCVHVITGSF